MSLKSIKLNSLIPVDTLSLCFVCACDSVQNLAPTVSPDKTETGLVGLDSALQEQERIITMSYALASEASIKSKQVAGGSVLSCPIIVCTFDLILRSLSIGLNASMTIIILQEAFQR